MSTDPRDEATPFVPGRIYGLRTWRVRWSASRPVLSGVFQSAGWADRLEPTKARCRGAGMARSTHDAPDPNCRCGIYGMHPSQIGEWFEMTRRPFDWGPSVHGIVEAWGRVELHEDGFRAEYARPHAMVHVDGYGSWTESREVAEALRIEHLSFDSVADVAPYCEKHGLGMDRATVAELNPYTEMLGPESAGRAAS
jgi:hypothetical protein